MKIKTSKAALISLLKQARKLIPDDVNQQCQSWHKRAEKVLGK